MVVTASLELLLPGVLHTDKMNTIRKEKQSTAPPCCKFQAKLGSQVALADQCDHDA